MYATAASQPDERRRMTTVPITSPPATARRPRAARVGDAVIAAYIHALSDSRRSTATPAHLAPAADLAGPAPVAISAGPAGPAPVATPGDLGTAGRGLARRPHGRRAGRRSACPAPRVRGAQPVSA